MLPHVDCGSPHLLISFCLWMDCIGSLLSGLRMETFVLVKPFVNAAVRVIRVLDPGLKLKGIVLSKLWPLNLGALSLFGLKICEHI